MNHKLEADSIQLEFGSRRILSSVYLKCETGKITGLLGSNGAGKTCLMQIIYGTLSCEKSVRIDSEAKQQAFKIPGLLAYLPQFNFIPKSLSLKRIFKDFALEFPPFTQRFPEFSSAYHTSIGKLTSGGQRLVELYVIAKSKASFAMLDEPFTHLSPLHIEQVSELIQEEKANKGFLVTDHMYRQVLDICDTLYVLSDGEIHLTRTAADIETFGYARFYG